MAETADALWSDVRRNETKLSAHDHLSWTVLSCGTQVGIERLESMFVAFGKKLTDKLDDEIKLAGLEALVPEELEKHLILNSDRLRTFEDARLEVVTYLEAKFGLRIRDSKPSDTGARGHSDPTDVGAVNSLSSGKGEGSPSPCDGCLKCGGAHFQRDCNVRKGTGKQSSGKGKQSKSWSKSEGKGKSKENKRKSKESPKQPKVRSKVPKAHTGGKHRKLVYQVWKTRNQREVRALRNLHKHVPLTIHGFMMDVVLTNGMMAGVVMNGMMAGVLLDDTKVGKTYDTSASSHSLGVWMSVPETV